MGTLPTEFKGFIKKYIFGFLTYAKKDLVEAKALLNKQISLNKLPDFEIVRTAFAGIDAFYFKHSPQKNNNLSEKAQGVKIEDEIEALKNKIEVMSNREKDKIKPRIFGLLKLF